MLVQDLVAAMEAIAPPSHAESWDKIGLLVGDRQRALSGPVVLAIDLTESVLSEAVEMGAGAIVSYHPPIFEPLNRVTNDTPRQRVVMRAIEQKIAIYSPHSALDAIPGGITDWLCEGLSGGASTPEGGKIAGDCRSMAPAQIQPGTQQVKIVTFLPASEADKVRNALASAGAGIIGNYQLCSFAATGEGTFLAGEGAKPRVGGVGRLEHVSELRLEMVCSRAALPLATATLKRFHPYEEPPIEVYELSPLPQRDAGAGRRLVLDQPATVPELAQRLKAFLKRDRVRYSIAGEERPLKRVGVVPGSGASLSRLARQEGCDVFVTGEMKHHEILGALNAGMSVILGGHTGTERGYLPRLKHLLEKRLAGARVAISAKDVEILVTI